jgi:hypothetical protein
MAMNKKEKEARFQKLRPVIVSMLDDGKGPYQIGKKLGLPHSSIQSFIKRINGETLDSTETERSPHSAKPPRVGSLFSQKGHQAQAMVTDFKVRTLEDLIEACNVDMDMWECTSFDIKCWEMGRKAKNTKMTFDQGVASGTTHDTGKIHVQPLYSVVAKFKRKAERTADEVAEYFKEMLSEIEIYSWTCKKHYAEATNTLELMIPDLHLGQLSWGEETGKDYNMEIACNLMKTAVRDLVNEAGPRIKKIAFPIGNDFFNVDNNQNQTTKGTQQDEEASWMKSFRIGYQCLIELISELSTRYEVDVMVVPGNHDEQRAFYLGEVLWAFFRNEDRVTIDNAPTSRKYRLYGCTLVGYSHGDSERPKDLPMLMAHQCPNLWAQSLYREWHHGHVHHERNIEMGAVKMRHFPALVAPDSWHTKKGYVMSVRQACAIEYSEDGPIRQYNWYPAMADKD